MHRTDIDRPANKDPIPDRRLSIPSVGNWRPRIPVYKLDLVSVIFRPETATLRTW
jgi:hypothetical protein